MITASNVTGVVPSTHCKLVALGAAILTTGASSTAGGAGGADGHQAGQAGPEHRAAAGVHAAETARNESCQQRPGLRDV